MHLQVSTGDILHLMRQYGYVVYVAVVFLGALGLPLPEEALIVLLGALSAQRNGPSFLLLVALGLPAALAGDLIVYGLGRFGGPFARRWLARLQRRRPDAPLARADPALTRRGQFLLFASRCLLPLLRTPVTLLAGLGRAPFLAFLAVDALGEVAHALGYLGLGWLFGPGIANVGPASIALWSTLLLLTLGPLALWRLDARRRHPAVQTAGQEGPAPAVRAGVEAAPRDERRRVR